MKLSPLWPLILYYYLAYNFAITILFLAGKWVAAYKGTVWPFDLTGTLILSFAIGNMCFFHWYFYHVCKILKKDGC